MLFSEIFKEFYLPTHHSLPAIFLYFGLDGHNALVPWIWTAIIMNVLATLTLAWPGVQAVRADETPAAASETAPAAVPGAAKAAPKAKVVPARRDGEIVSAPRVENPRQPGPDDVITLNTRGYNYGPDRPTVRPELLKRPAAPAAPAAQDD